MGFKDLKILFIYLVSLSAVILISTELFSQNLITKENADCEHPIVLTDTTFGPSNPPIGYGKAMELSAEKNNIYYFEKEHNTVWYKFTSPGACSLTLDIIPTDKNNDYDFLIFKYTNSNFCKDIKSKTIKPIRTNISRNDPGINSITGLSKSAEVEYVHSGPGAQFSKALDVKRGDVYYLVVDNVYDNGDGHTVNLHYSDCRANSWSYTLNVVIVDKATGKPVKASIDILRFNQKDNDKLDYQFKEKDNCSVKLDSRQSYFLQLSAKGYLNYSEEIVLLKAQQTFTQKVELEKIEAGKNFKISNIYFVGDLPSLLPTSMPALKYLLKFMQENQDVKIEIQGHVNWPSTFGIATKQQEEFNLKLSNDRAKAVYDYLIKNEIDSSRLSFKGFSNTNMLYPDAKTEQEKQQNRRVEIKIVSE